MPNTEKKFAALVADAFQDSEFFLPKIEIHKAGYEIEVISIGTDPVDMWAFFESIGRLKVDKAIASADPSDYAGVLIPGGAKSPATLAESDEVLSFVRAIGESGKLIAPICRGALLAAKAGVAKGRKITGFRDDSRWPELAIWQTVEEHGGIWQDDQPAVIDGNLISSRHPDDTPAFTQAIMDWLRDRA